MPLTLEQLVDAGFSAENFPADLPAPSPETIEKRAELPDGSLSKAQELYRYQVKMEGSDYAMEILVDRSTIENPAEGVNFMLNQFGYLWRTDREKVAVAEDGSCRRIVF